MDTWRFLIPVAVVEIETSMPSGRTADSRVTSSRKRVAHVRSVDAEEVENWAARAGHVPWQGGLCFCHAAGRTRRRVEGSAGSIPILQFA